MVASLLFSIRRFGIPSNVSGWMPCWPKMLMRRRFCWGIIRYGRSHGLFFTTAIFRRIWLSFCLGTRLMPIFAGIHTIKALCCTARPICRCCSVWVLWSDCLTRRRFRSTTFKPFCPRPMISWRFGPAILKIRLRDGLWDMFHRARRVWNGIILTAEPKPWCVGFGLVTFRLFGRWIPRLLPNSLKQICSVFARGCSVFVPGIVWEMRVYFSMGMRLAFCRVPIILRPVACLYLPTRSLVCRWKIRCVLNLLREAR